MMDFTDMFTSQSTKTRTKDSGLYLKENLSNNQSLKRSFEEVVGDGSHGSTGTGALKLNAPQPLGDQQEIEIEVRMHIFYGANCLAASTN